MCSRPTCCADFASRKPDLTGKSTLLDTLAGRLPRSVLKTGTMLVNGHTSSLTFGKSVRCIHSLSEAACSHQWYLAFVPPVAIMA